MSKGINPYPHKFEVMKNDIVSLNTKIDNNMFIISQNIKNDIKNILSEYFKQNN